MIDDDDQNLSLFSHNEMQLKVEVTVDSGIVTHSTSSFRQPIKRLHVGHLIGKGAFGQVHEGVVRLSHHDSKDWTRVAVKRLKGK